MKQAAGEMENHILQNVLTMARCWTLALVDELGQATTVTIAVTSHTRSLVVAGITYEPLANYSNIKTSEGMQVNTVDVITGITDALEADIENGLFDNAFVEVFDVNYQDPDTGRIVLQRGNVGDIVRGSTAVASKIRGITDNMKGQFGRVFGPQCMAQLGDLACTVPLKESFGESGLDVDFIEATELIERLDGVNWGDVGYDVGDFIEISAAADVENNGIFKISALLGTQIEVLDSGIVDATADTVFVDVLQDYVYPDTAITDVDADDPGRIFYVGGGLTKETDGSLLEDDWFAEGLVEPTTGANIGLKRHIREYRSSTGRITCFTDFPYPFEIGDEVRLIVGCNKVFQTCIDKFDNAINFRGFPHVPTNDEYFSIPTHSGTTTDFSTE